MTINAKDIRTYLQQCSIFCVSLGVIFDVALVKYYSWAGVLSLYWCKCTFQISFLLYDNHDNIPDNTCIVM